MLDTNSSQNPVATLHDPVALDAFLRPGCGAAILDKPMPAGVSHWLEAQNPEHLPRGRTTLRAGAVAATVGHLCDMFGLPAGAERDWLETDITALAAMFSDLVSADYLRLRLDVVSGNACRKFHVDALTARLVCTYRGTGTQYGIALDGQDPKEVFTVPTGAPILLHGTLSPEHCGSGLLHRSPPIEGTGETRLVLVLDPVTHLSEATE